MEGHVCLSVCMCVRVCACTCECVCLEEGAGSQQPMKKNEWLEKPVTAFWGILQLKIYWDISEVIARLHLATADLGPGFLSLFQRNCSKFKTGAYSEFLSSRQMHAWRWLGGLALPVSFPRNWWQEAVVLGLCVWSGVSDYAKQS